MRAAALLLAAQAASGGCAPAWPEGAPPCDPTADADLGAPLLAFDGPPPTNLLMISVDTLRRDRLGRYGGSAPSAFLDGLLAEGVALDDHRSCSNWTYVGMLCALTGADAVDLGFMPTTHVGAPPILPGSVETLAETLGRAGYQSSVITANTILGVSYGMSHAYQRIDEGPAGGGAGEVVATALRQIDSGWPDASPWFLHLHFIDPHDPYNPPGSYLEGLDALAPLSLDVWRGDVLEQVAASAGDYSAEEMTLIREHLRLRYNAEITYLDDTLAGLWRALQDRGLLEDTLVVLYTDHGEQFFEHGAVLHHQGVYQEETDAVAGFWARGLRPAAWGAPTTHRDLVPTLLMALGVAAPASVTGAIVGTRPEVCARYAESMDEEIATMSVDHGGLRLVYDWDGRLSLYDREGDPQERYDLHTPGSEDAAALWGLLSPRAHQMAPLHPTLEPAPPSL